MRSKAYYLQQVHQPRHLKESARMFGPDILEVRTRLHFDLTSNVSCKCEIDVYSNGVVCRAYILDTYHDLPVPSFSLPIHRTSPDFLRKSYHTPISHLLHFRGLRCENNVMFFPRKHCVDDSGVHFTSLLVPCRPLASR